jgi:hypothetical protein
MHPKRNLHLCSLGGGGAIGGKYQNCFRNDTTIHRHGDIILVRFFHMSFRIHQHFGFRKATAPLFRPSRTRAPYWENRLSDIRDSLRESLAYPILFLEDYRCFCIWRAGETCRRVGASAWGGVTGYWSADPEHGRGDADELGLPKAGWRFPAFSSVFQHWSD